MASAAVQPCCKAEMRIRRRGLMGNLDGVGKRGTAERGAPTALKCSIDMPLGGPAGTDDLGDGLEIIGASVGARARPVKRNVV
jgi:hypothetical protein